MLLLSWLVNIVLLVRTVTVMLIMTVLIVLQLLMMDWLREIRALRNETFHKLTFSDYPNQHFSALKKVVENN